MTSSKPSEGKRASTLVSLRLTSEERQLLDAHAKANQYLSISSYIRAKLFPSASAAAHAAGLQGETRLSAADRQKLLARILGTLGQSKALANLTELAEAARIGVLPLAPDVLAEIRGACADIVDIRRVLLKALGIRKAEEAKDDHER